MEAQRDFWGLDMAFINRGGGGGGFSLQRHFEGNSLIWGKKVDIELYLVNLKDSVSSG